MDRHVCDSSSGITRTTAFSLVELVLVVVIIGIIAGIAVPRISQAGAQADARALLATLNNVRDAIDRYYAEHGKFPGYDPSNDNPDGDWFIKQLTKYTDAAGDVKDSPGGDYVYGPYLRSPFPSNPFNGLSTVKVKPTDGGAVTLNATGWIAVLSDGTFTINTASAKLPVEVVSEKERVLAEKLRTGS
ncbi:MAG: hypothetical protein H6817_10380 [Phycisphaerales bacterium]|nr:hypothetical protein [Phycisphaerales bacterium]